MDITSMDLSSMATADIEALIEAARAELASRQQAPAKVLIKIQIGSYNDRRYGKPWIGRITAWSNGKPEIEWGTYHGDASGGELHIMAAIGDIIRWGQRDNRNPRKTENEWAIVNAVGGFTGCDQAAARNHWLATHGA